MRLLLVGVAALAVAMPHARALEPGDAPPPIGMVDQRGEKVDLSDLEGKVVLVDFWASWCGPCRKEMPVLEQLYAKYADQGLVIIGVNIDRNKKKMISFLAGVPVSFHIVHDPELVAASRYEPPGMPSSYFIARDGKIRHVHEGFRKKDAPEIENRIKLLLEEPTNPN
jgi:thiol-disulfide isomerase/thioredoxin